MTAVVAAVLAAPTLGPHRPADIDLEAAPDRQPLPAEPGVQQTPGRGTDPGWLLVCPVLANWLLTLLVLGEADIATADELRLQLTDAIASWPYATVIDLSGLTFCGLAGMDALHAAQRAAAQMGRDVQLLGMSRQLLWLSATFPETVITDGRS